MLFTLFFVLSVLSALLCSGPIVNVLILLSRNFGLYIWLDLLFLERCYVSIGCLLLVFHTCATFFGGS